MTIFRSKAKAEQFTHLELFVKNEEAGPLHILMEPGCEEFDLEEGDKLRVRIPIKELRDSFDPLQFDTWSSNRHISIWVPPFTNCEVIKK